MREPASARASSARYTNGGHTHTSADAVGSLSHDGLDQRGVFRARAVHLPVACDDLTAHVWQPMQAASAAKKGARDDSGAPLRNATRRTTAAISSAQRTRVRLSSRASTMTRMTGSVPDGRSTTRPSSPELRIATRCTVSSTSGTALGSKRSRHLHVDHGLRETRHAGGEFRQALPGFAS